MTTEDDIKNLFSPEERGWLESGLRAQLIQMEETRKRALALVPADFDRNSWGPQHPATHAVDRAERLQELMQRFGMSVGK